MAVMLNTAEMILIRNPLMYTEWDLKCLLSKMCKVYVKINDQLELFPMDITALVHGLSFHHQLCYFEKTEHRNVLP